LGLPALYLGADCLLDKTGQTLIVRQHIFRRLA